MQMNEHGFLSDSTSPLPPNEARRQASVPGLGPDSLQSGSRCLACGLPITNGEPVFRIRDLVVHLKCAVYRRRRVRC
jgi:hypothetical protein